MSRPRPLSDYRQFFTDRLADRFLSKVDMPSSAGACWIWKGTLDHNGYGKLSIGPRRDPVLKQKMATAHRVAYALAYGVDAPGLGFAALDHLCNNIRCVNPAHLEPVTTAENTARREARKHGGYVGRGSIWHVPPSAEATEQTRDRVEAELTS